jgi:hypothetical protein
VYTLHGEGIGQCMPQTLRPVALGAGHVLAAQLELGVRVTLVEHRGGVRHHPLQRVALLRDDQRLSALEYRGKLGMPLAERTGTASQLNIVISAELAPPLLADLLVKIRHPRLHRVVWASEVMPGHRFLPPGEQCARGATLQP